MCLSCLSEYEVVSTTTGPHGKEVSILTTNQTHTAVENLTPESKYETMATVCDIIIFHSVSEQLAGLDYNTSNIGENKTV